MAKIAVIGSGFSGLSAAAYLAAAGHEVHVYEKHDQCGGRARQLKTANGYTFDMGPSWYWMPDLYERFFNDFGYTVSDLYQLQQLDPSFEMVFKDQFTMRIPAHYSRLCTLFESIERGSAAQLTRFLRQAHYKYQAGMDNLVNMPGLSFTELIRPELLKGMMQLQVFSSFSRHVRKFFSDHRLISLMEFPALFLGAMPKDIPAMYSLMNYAALKTGTWYPKGGFGKIAEAVKQVAASNGTFFHFNASVEKIEVEGRLARSIRVNGETEAVDAVIAAADYHYVESCLLSPSYRNYQEGYWRKKLFAPSCLIYFVGLSRKIDSLQHHTLFFDEDLDQHSREIYQEPQWPAKPLFYVCCPSRSDDTVAPAGHENLFFLMPVATGLQDTEDIRQKYFTIMLERFQRYIGMEITSFIDYQKSYCINDFIADYHACRGNAYGLANTLRQTAHLKPKITNRKIHNLFYAGQLTVPGPGVPPSLISGKIVAQQLLKRLKNEKHEGVVR